MQEYLLGS
jgi:carboxy-terminal domain RNA polymerase II polypeptide A small phosphatase